MKFVKNQRGYSLVELSIVLAIIAVVIAGSVTGIQSLLRANSVNNVIGDTNKSVNRIVAKMVRDSNYSGVTTANMAALNMDVWPETSIDRTVAATPTVSHPFGGSVWVAPLGTAVSTYSINQAYIYTLTGIPVAACSDVALGIAPLASIMTIVNEAPKTAAITAMPTSAGATVKSTSVAATSSAITAACNGGATGVQTATISLLIPRS